MFRRRVSPPPAEWDLIVEIRNGRALLAGDTVEVYLHDDGTVTAWRGVDDWCHIGNHATAHKITHVAQDQGIPIRANGGPPPMNSRGAIQL